jgi:hypothetical protein
MIRVATSRLPPGMRLSTTLVENRQALDKA